MNSETLKIEPGMILVYYPASPLSMKEMATKRAGIEKEVRKALGHWAPPKGDLPVGIIIMEGTGDRMEVVPKQEPPSWHKEFLAWAKKPIDETTINALCGIKSTKDEELMEKLRESAAWIIEVLEKTPGADYTEWGKRWELIDKLRDFAELDKQPTKIPPKGLQPETLNTFIFLANVLLGDIKP